MTFLSSVFEKSKELSSDRRGVFGLTSVQAFFAIILGIAILGYVIVVIVGVLNNASILTDITTQINNESSFANSSGDFVNAVNAAGFNSPIMLIATNRTSGAIITQNVTLSSAGLLTNTTPVNYNAVNISYTYNTFSVSENQTNAILLNTSSGITSFFSSINPVYAILAILVIILVLVVLVRVVTGSTGSGVNIRAEPQL